MIWTAFTAELRREITQLVRYPTEFLSEAIFIAVVFYGLFLGGSYMAGRGILGSRLSDIIIGYALWTLMLGAIGNMGWGIANEAQNGTLEQVCLAPVRIRTIFALRSLANLVYDLALTGIALILIMLVTHHDIHFSLLELVPVIQAIGVSIGIGYLVASVTILFKRSNQFLNLLQFAVLFLVMTPFTDLPGALKYIAVVVPIGPQMGVLRRLALGQAHFPGEEAWLLLGIVNMLLWIGIGYFVYGAAHDRARGRGALGHY
ncbi:MAG: ABC transporter permease [Thermaerobacter sp.]|nr:ABC transporter permease [Thermaerobacter sp.]